MLNLNLLEALDDLDSINDVAENADLNQNAEKIYEQYNGIPYNILYEWLDKPEYYAEQILVCAGILAHIPSRNGGTYANTFINKDAPADSKKTWLTTLVAMANANIAEQAFKDAGKVYYTIYENSKYTLCVAENIEFCDATHNTLHTGRGLDKPDLISMQPKLTFDVKGCVNYKLPNKYTSQHGSDYVLLVNTTGSGTVAEYITVKSIVQANSYYHNANQWKTWAKEQELDALPTISIKREFFNAKVILSKLNMEINSPEIQARLNSDRLKQFRCAGDVKKAQTLYQEIANVTDEIQNDIQSLTADPQLANSIATGILDDANTLAKTTNSLNATIKDLANDKLETKFGDEYVSKEDDKIKDNNTSNKNKKAYKSNKNK